MKMRPYQRECEEEIHRRWLTGWSTLACLPTGCGKTIIFGHAIKPRLDLGRAIVLVHRTELADQAAAKIEAVTGVHCDIEMGDRQSGDGTIWGGSRIVVASVQSLASADRMEKFNPMEFATLVVDEAHHGVANQFRTAIDYFHQNPNLKLLGVTATPDRKDKESLGQIFETCAYKYHLWDAIKEGWLVNLTHCGRELKGLDLSRVKMVDGKFNEKQLAAELASNENLEAVAAAIVECAEDRQSLIFSDTKENAATLTEILHGHKRNQARLVTDDTPPGERRDVFKDFHESRYQYLVNVGICIEGWDEEKVRCVVLACPDGSRMRVAQKCGRGTRTTDHLAHTLDGYANGDERRSAIAASEKPDTLIIDFVDSTQRHDIARPSHILGGRVSDRATLAVNSRKDGKPVDLIEAMEEADRVIRHNDELAQAASDREGVRAKMKTRPNPFAIYGLPRSAPNSGQPMDAGQRAKMEKWRIKNFEDLDSGGADQIIEEVRSRARRGLLTLNQENVLRRAGYECHDMTFETARGLMDELAAKQGWRKPKAVPA